MIKLKNQDELLKMDVGERDKYFKRLPREGFDRYFATYPNDELRLKGTVYTQMMMVYKEQKDRFGKYW